MYRQWLRQGYFSVHTGRFKFHAGTRAYEQLKHFLQTCPFVELVENYKTGQKCRKYRFVLRAVSVVETESELLVRLRVLPGYTRLVVVDDQWLNHRREQWLAWCKKNGTSPSCDFDGSSLLGAAAIEAISSIELPADDSWMAEKTGRKLAFAKWFVDSAINGTLLGVVYRKDGRSYHPGCMMPRDLRRQSLLDGEPLTECDLGSCYFACLASMLPDCDEKERLISSLKSGSFYAELFEEAGLELDKPRVQKEILFNHDLGRRKQWLLFDALARLYPGLTYIIERLRKKHGPSGFSKVLMRIEGQVMDLAWTSLAKLGVKSLRLHDAMLCAESQAAKVSDAIRSAGLFVLGFVPRVSIK